MKSHSQLTDAAFELQFSQCEFAPSLFNHEAHLRLEWIHINNYGIAKVWKADKQVKSFEFITKK
ncbi:MAG: hypothetical protein AAF611_12745 [Bacteroidota bacterium]